MIDQTQTTLYPGGILNTGFAVAWAQERDARGASRPTPRDPDHGGQPWAVPADSPEGDQTCADNQALHPEAADLLAKIRANDHYVPEVADPLSPITFVNKINVPVFMACQWTDEQTGGHCPTLAEHMTGTDKKWFTFTNGTHVDSLDPETYNKLVDFLKLYVAQQTGADRSSRHYPGQRARGHPGDLRDQRARAASPPAMTLPPDPIQAQPTYRPRQGRVRGAARRSASCSTTAPGNSSQSRLALSGLRAVVRRASRSRAPTARSWYLAPGRRASPTSRRSDAAADGFTWDAHARPLTDFTGDTGSGAGGLWTATPHYQWTPGPRPAPPSPTSPRRSDRRHDRDRRRRGGPLGPLLHAQRRPSGDDQRGPARRQGDLRAERLDASQRARALDRGQEHGARARPEPAPGGLRADALRPFVPVTIPLYYEGHVYRAGSRIRVRISAPNGDQPIWSFGETEPAGPANVAIGYGEAMPSRLDPPGGAGRDRADRAAAVPGPARRAVPRLPALPE